MPGLDGVLNLLEVNLLEFHVPSNSSDLSAAPGGPRTPIYMILSIDLIENKTPG